MHLVGAKVKLVEGFGREVGWIARLGFWICDQCKAGSVRQVGLKRINVGKVQLGMGFREIG